MNKKKQQLVFILSLIVVQVSAQLRVPMYISQEATSKYASKVYDITFKEPKGFVDMKMSEAWVPGKKGLGDYTAIYQLFQSKDSSCILMYPTMAAVFPTQRDTSFRARSLAVDDIHFALGLRTEIGLPQKGDTIDWNKYLTVYTDKYARQRFNADTVFIVELPIKESYKEKYTYCTGVYISKKDRPTLFFKFLFTETGKQREQEHLKLLYKRIRYKNNNWVYDEEKAIEGFKILESDRYK